MSIPLRAALATLLLLIAVAGVAQAGDEGSAASSTRGDDADYVYSYEVDAPVERMWDLLTTKEGLESWAVPTCVADFRPGGTLKTRYDKGPIDDPNTIVHHIDAVVRHKMFSARVTPPANGGVMKLLGKTRNVTTFEPLLPDRTRVVYRSYGWGKGAEWDALRKAFDGGNAWTVKRLEKLIPPRDRAAEVAETLQAFKAVQGGWMGTYTPPDSEPLQIFAQVEAGPGAASYLIRSQMRSGEKSWLSSSVQLWVAPKPQAVRFREVSMDGSTSSGVVDLEVDGDKRTLVWSWKKDARDGTSVEYRIEQVLDNAKAFTQRIFQKDAQGVWSPFFELVFKRVDGTPAGFSKED